MKTVVFAIILSALTTTPLAAQWVKHPTPGIPRTADGNDQVTVGGYRAKDGSKMANGTKVTLPDGRQVFSGPTADGSPTP